MSESVSVIIPYLNKWNLVHARLMEYYKNLPGCEIVLVDDCSNQSDAITGPNWWKKNTTLNIKKVRNETNLGFGRSNNVGVSVSSGDVIILTQNDVETKGDFIKPVLQNLKQYKKILIGGRVIYWPAGWNEFVVDGQKIVIPYAEGWFLAMYRETWDDLGGFDPIYGKMDYEDIDLSAKAISKGYNLVGLNLAFLKHLFGQTTTATMGVEGRRAITEANRKIFYEKWKDWMLKWKNVEVQGVK